MPSGDVLVAADLWEFLPHLRCLIVWSGSVLSLERHVNKMLLPQPMFLSDLF